MHCSGVTSDNGPAVNGPAVTSRNCVLDPRKNETLDVVTSKTFYTDVSVTQERKRIVGFYKWRDIMSVTEKWQAVFARGQNTWSSKLLGTELYGCTGDESTHNNTDNCVSNYFVVSLVL